MAPLSLIIIIRTLTLQLTDNNTFLTTNIQAHHNLNTKTTTQANNATKTAIARNNWVVPSL